MLVDRGIGPSLKREKADPGQNDWSHAAGKIYDVADTARRSIASMQRLERSWPARMYLYWRRDGACAAQNAIAFTVVRTPSQ